MKKLFATKDFNDAGTGKAFKAGEELTGLNAGELGNYEHAGLAGDKPTGTTDKAPEKAA